MGLRKRAVEKTRQISIEDALAAAKKPRKIYWLHDDLTNKIIGAVRERSHKNAIVRRTKEDDGTVRNRLKQLENSGYIKHHEERTGGLKRNVYVLTPKGEKEFSVSEPKTKTPQNKEEEKREIDRWGV